MRSTPPRLYLLPTPAGAYYASVEGAEDRLRGFLRLLLAQPASPAWHDEDDGFVRRLAAVGWVQYLPAPRCARREPLDEALPPLLRPLSSGGRAVLADAHGFHLASAGFGTADAEGLAALSADLASLSARHRRTLSQTLGLYGSAWSVPDAAGHSQIGFWPIHVGRQRFVLILGDVPHLNQPELVDLVWLLHQRYGPLADVLGPLTATADTPPHVNERFVQESSQVSDRLGA